MSYESSKRKVLFTKSHLCIILLTTAVALHHPLSLLLSLDIARLAYDPESRAISIKKAQDEGVTPRVEVIESATRRVNQTSWRTSDSRSEPDYVSERVGIGLAASRAEPESSLSLTVFPSFAQGRCSDL